MYWQNCSYINAAFVFDGVSYILVYLFIHWVSIWYIENLLCNTLILSSNIIYIINHELFIVNFRQSYPSKYKPPNATLTSNDIRNLITSSFWILHQNMVSNTNGCRTICRCVYHDEIKKKRLKICFHDEIANFLIIDYFIFIKE